MREVEEASEKGDWKASLGLDMYHYRIRKYIGAYAAAMGGVDILIFTGGIGENSEQTRSEVCKDFEYLGLKFDADKNKGVRGKEKVISADDSKVTVIIVPTNEELVIARDTRDIVSDMAK